MMIPGWFYPMLVISFFLVGCASTHEFNTEGIDSRLTPKRAVNEIQTLQGRPVLWGGTIITSTNLKDATQLEILAYPLDSNQRPNSQETPLGRFLAMHLGYLETSDYSQGRFITVRGTLGDTRKGQIGETEYTYPVVNINQLHLWSKGGDLAEPRIQFGIGVILRN